MKILNKIALIFILVYIILLFACKSKTAVLTENEYKGVIEVTNFYGGLCEYKVQKEYTPGIPTKTTFLLKLSKSLIIDSLATIAELPSSNAAYIFYKNLKAERKKYNQVSSELIFSNNRTIKFNYSIEQLENVDKKLILVKKIVALLKVQNYSAISNYLTEDTSLYKFNKKEVLSKLQSVDSEFGEIKEFITYGFKFFKAANGKEILHLSGLIKRSKQNNYFSINLDPASIADELYTLNYQL